MTRKISILKLDHRSFRDQRVTTHVGLTSRALGANFFIYSGERDESFTESLQDVILRWGGDMKINYLETVKSYIQHFEGITVHLTMYGEDHTKTISELKKYNDENLLIIVGGSKVPRYIYDLVDFNTAIGWQPHSEVAAVAILLHELNKNEFLYKEYSNTKAKISKSNFKSKRSRRFSNL